MEFKKIIINSFKAVKRDFDVLRVALSDWVNYLVQRDNQLQERLEALEARVAELEEHDKIVVTAY